MTDTADQNERQKTSGTIDTCDYYFYGTSDICSQSSAYYKWIFRYGFFCATSVFDWVWDCICIEYSDAWNRTGNLQE